MTDEDEELLEQARELYMRVTDLESDLSSFSERLRGRFSDRTHNEGVDAASVVYHAEEHLSEVIDGIQIDSDYLELEQ